MGIRCYNRDVDPDPATKGGIAFGRFRVLPHRRELLVDDQPTKLGGRAFDLLLALVEAGGGVLSKDALMARVWPGRIVDENALQSQIVALRRVFGPDRDLIRTVSGRGYLFTGEIRTVRAMSDGPATTEMPQSTPAASRPPTNLPEAVSQLIGREAELNKVLDLSTSHRLVTLTGAGGIGKTRLGFEVARYLLPRFADGVWVIDLAPLSDPELVPFAVATALGLELSSGMASPLSVADALRAKQLMLVFDNCEHVVDAAAQMVEALLRANPAARVIATSREPLHAEGEWVYPVPPLEVPAEDLPEIEDSLRYGAVLLFVERARAAGPQFSSEGRVAAAIAAICRRLDGIPLGIELAAARAAALGIEGLAAGLDDRFQLLAGGRRTALPRHQTLRATLDWSYELLTDPERAVLRRLTIFATGFTLEAASAVVTDDEIAASEVLDCVASLVRKSLVTVDVGDTMRRYRLLETTRAYAREKLVQSGEFDAVARRHAERYRDLFEAAETESMTRPTDEWLADYVPRMDNLRAALDWAFSPGGDGSIGVALATAAIPLWMYLSVMDECRSRVEQVLAALGAEPDRDISRRRKLYAALATSLTYSRGQVPETLLASRNALDAAEKLDDTEHRLQALYGLWNAHAASGDMAAAMDFAGQFHRLAVERSHATDVLMGDRMLGSVLHFSGEHAAARHHLETMLSGYVPPVHRPATMRHQFDQRIVARALLARVCWIQGFPDQATAFAVAAVENALATNHANAECYSLVEGACPVALFTGDFDSTNRLVLQLLDRSARYGLTTWQILGRSFEAELLIRSGDTAIGLPRLRTVLEDVNERQLLLRFPPLLGVLAEACALTGRVSEAAGAVEQAIAASERTGVRWCLPELLRIKGEIALLYADGSGRRRAKEAFNQALELGRHQGALSWQLRAALSLARLWIEERRSREARELVQAIYEGFTEGFQTRDLLEARALINGP
jgi:predicted ATPase/DNA-binding winged helix-turn-helix (wHTH) protein